MISQCDIAFNGWNAGNPHSSSDVTNHRGFTRDLHAVTDGQMPSHASLPAQYNIIAHVHAAANTHQTHKQTMLAYACSMSNGNQIREFGSRANARLFHRGAFNDAA